MIEIYRSPPQEVEGYLAYTVKYDTGLVTTVLEHREVMQKKLGRKLFPTEIVHHKDRNKKNNSPDNLELTNKSEHAKEHAKEHPAEKISATCTECGKPIIKNARVVRHNQETQGRQDLSVVEVAPENIAKGFTPPKYPGIDIPHGTKTAYGYHKCRCDICRAANTERTRAYRKIKDSRSGGETR